MKILPLDAILAYLKATEMSFHKSDTDSELELSQSTKDLRDIRFPGLPDEYLPPPIEANSKKLIEGYAEIRKPK